jgi:DNA-binding CsgD family transcriptional regulator
MLAGDLAGAEDTLARLAAETVGRSDWEMADNVLLWGRGMLQRTRGRLDDCASALESVTPGAMGLGAGIQADRAIALAMMGDRAGAEGALALARQIGSSFSQAPLIEFGPRTAEIHVVAASGDLDRAVTVALACARDARAKGAVSVASRALQAVVSLGAAHLVRDELEVLGARMQGELIRVSVDGAVAAANDDGPALLDVAERFAELGFLVLAAESAARAAVAVAAATGPGSAQARRAAARATALIGRCQHLRTPAVIALTAGQLSVRERQIATLAADGQTSQQIADRLVLSVRTVDNHLQHVYTKLGVSSRQDLAGLL